MLESKRRAIIFLLLAVLLAAVSGLLVLQKVKALNSDLGTMVTVYKAAGEIPSRKIITPDDISTEEIPKQYLRDEHITDVEDLMNKVSIVPLAGGDIITANMLKQASAITEAKNRLVTVLKSEKVVFDEKLTALDRTDIIVSHTFGEEPVTEVFMEDVKVARVPKNEEEDFSGVQLEVPYEKVSELIHMQNYADSLRLVKANVAEEEQLSNASDKKLEDQKKGESGEDSTDEEADNDSENEKDQSNSNEKKEDDN